jgi:hypothetical protein
MSEVTEFKSETNKSDSPERKQKIKFEKMKAREAKEIVPLD